MRAVLSRVGRSVMTSGHAWIPPATGAVFLVFWVVWAHIAPLYSHVERHTILAQSVVFLMLAAALACARWIPFVSLGLLVAVPLGQALRVLAPPNASTWPVYLAGPLVALFVGLMARGLTRYLCLPVGVAYSALAAYCVVNPAIATFGGWSVWTGDLNATVRQGVLLIGFAGMSLHPLWVEFFTLAPAMFGVLAAAWAIGVAAATAWQNRSFAWALRATQEQLSATDLELLLSQDRARIAHDVHDALAHSLAVIVAQAEGSHALRQARPEITNDSLVTIAETGRAALLDVRRLIEEIQVADGASPASPAAADVEELLTRVREANPHVDVVVRGEPVALPTVQHIAVYRILQESLTNALKHCGNECTVDVSLDWDEGGLALSVISISDRPLSGVRSAGGGFGIPGMIDRARRAGGWLTASASENRMRFTVTAFIPRAAAPADGRRRPARRGARVEPGAVLERGAGPRRAAVPHRGALAERGAQYKHGAA